MQEAAGVDVEALHEGQVTQASLSPGRPTMLEEGGSTDAKGAGGAHRIPRLLWK